MNTVKCPACNMEMIRHGKTKAGRQRWRCNSCSITILNTINNDAKNLELFLSWLLSGKTLNSMPGLTWGVKQWQTKRHAFLQEVTYHEHSWSYTHTKTVKACRNINSLIRNQLLFTYLHPRWDELMPATTNRIEGGVNAPLRQMLRDHRGLSLGRRIKSIFWWCYMHTQFPLPLAQILKVMPRDADIENVYWEVTRTNEIDAVIPRWGDAFAWHELHHTKPYRQDWD